MSRKPIPSSINICLVYFQIIIGFDAANLLANKRALYSVTPTVTHLLTI